MKWFKHQSTARNDEKLSRLEDKCGLEGYGFYFKMLEIVAEVLDQSNKCEVTYSLSRWGRQANITSKKWLFLSSCCGDVGLMIVQRLSDESSMNDWQISVKIPNLLKYRDNHTRNLQVTSKQEEDTDKEKELDIKSFAHSSNDAKKTDDKSTVMYSKAFLAFWDLYPNKKSKGDAFKAFKKINPSEYPAVKEGLLRAIDSDDWKKDGGQYIKHPGTWLRARGWEDVFVSPADCKKPDGSFDKAAWMRSMQA